MNIQHKPRPKTLKMIKKGFSYYVNNVDKEKRFKGDDGDHSEDFAEFSLGRDLAEILESDFSNDVARFSERSSNTLEEIMPLIFALYTLKVDGNYVDFLIQARDELIRFKEAKRIKLQRKQLIKKIIRDRERTLEERESELQKAKRAMDVAITNHENANSRLRDAIGYAEDFLNGDIDFDEVMNM